MCIRDRAILCIGTVDRRDFKIDRAAFGRADWLGAAGGWGCIERNDYWCNSGCSADNFRINADGTLDLLKGDNNELRKGRKASCSQFVVVIC